MPVGRALALALQHVNFNYVIEAGRVEGTFVDSVSRVGILSNELGNLYRTDF